MAISTFVSGSEKSSWPIVGPQRRILLSGSRGDTINSLRVVNEEVKKARGLGFPGTGCLQGD